jgi:hypothetical protein
MRRLVFFANSDPRIHPGNIRNAYHYAIVGHKAGVPTEVRLAADAVRAAHPDEIADTPDGAELRAKIAEAVALGLRVSL